MVKHVTRRWCLGLPLLAASRGLLAAESRQAILESEFYAYREWWPLPKFAFGHLIGIQDREKSMPLFVLIDGKGRKEEFTLVIPDDAVRGVTDFALSSAGEIGAVGSLVEKGRLDAFVARVSPDRQSQLVTRVWPYVPQAVVFAPDGTLWTMGSERSKSGGVRVTHQMRRFGRDGQLLSRANILYRRMGSGQISLVASKDRVGWLNAGVEYVEFSLDGRDIGRSDFEEAPADGVALSPGNQVLVRRKENGEDRVDYLDRNSRHWLPLEIQDAEESHFGWLIGFDGEVLVTFWGQNVQRYRIE
jgi:hypothetical protein